MGANFKGTNITCLKSRGLGQPNAGPGRGDLRVIKSRLGTKLTCHKCGAKFYDMKKKHPVCPGCDTEYTKVKTKQRRSSPTETQVPVLKTADKSNSEEEFLEGELNDDLLGGDDDKDEDNTIMEDTSDISEDNEDIGEVVGAVNDGEDKE